MGVQEHGWRFTLAQKQHQREEKREAGVNVYVSTLAQLENMKSKFKHKQELFECKCNNIPLNVVILYFTR